MIGKETSQHDTHNHSYWNKERNKTIFIVLNHWIYKNLAFSSLGGINVFDVNHLDVSLSKEVNAIG